jgi:nickel transport protein
VVSPTAPAHDLWLAPVLEPTGTRVAVNYRHPGDRPPPAIDKVLDLASITADGETSIRDGLSAAIRDGAPVLVTGSVLTRAPALVTARYDNGFWVETRQGSYRNSSRLVYPDAKERLWSIKFGKTVTAPGAPWDKIVGHESEIVPLSDPADVAPGNTLQILVLFRGTPLADAAVERGDGVTLMAETDIPKFHTDAAGVAAIPIVKAGPQLLAIDHKVVRSRAPQLAAHDLYNATLFFLVGDRRQ